MKISFLRRIKPTNATAGSLRNTYDRRAVVLGTGMGSVGMLLMGRMTYLSVFENEKYKLKSESNRISLSLVPPRRGWILDRNGRPLAADRADFRVDITPERLIDPQYTVEKLSQLLAFSPIELQELQDKLDRARGLTSIEVATRLTYEQYAAVSIRLPDLPGVVTQRGYSRFYPAGSSVGHLIGYVGAGSAEEYEKDRNPILLTPGYKLGKDAMEKFFEKELQGIPGARRAEVTASGRIVRDLDTRKEVPGKAVKTTIDVDIQEYAARRIGPESGAVVVMDCQTGDVLAMASMPCFDPNSFSDGIGRLEWKMLSDDDHVPLRNKVLRGLYPPGSTVKPLVALSFMEAGLNPNESVFCSGGLRVGNRIFHCWNRQGHGHVNMAKGIYQSCDVYFYHFAQRMGMDPIVAMAKRLGLGQEFSMPVAGQSYGTVPSPAWKRRKYNKEWQTFDTVNTTIGQGNFLVNPLQQAVQVSRIASGKIIMPRLLLSREGKPLESLGIPESHLEYVRKAMSDVVNGPGSAPHAALPLAGVKLAGKTGTAQVVGLNVGNGKGGLWKHRDHGHFICFAPADNPRYAVSVVCEHGGGSSSAYPIARDVMTYIFDRNRGIDILAKLEAAWGGSPKERQGSKFRAYTAQYGINAPRVIPEEERRKAEEADAARQAAVVITDGAVPPAPEPNYVVDTSVSTSNVNGRTPLH